MSQISPEACCASVTRSLPRDGHVGAAELLANVRPVMMLDPNWRRAKPAAFFPLAQMVFGGAACVSRCVPRGSALNGCRSASFGCQCNEPTSGH
jgi:hypothetical protein